MNLWAIEMKLMGGFTAPHSENIMDRIIYERDVEHGTREIDKMVFEFDPDSDIWRMKTVILRMLSAVGFTDKSIQDAFGSEIPPTENQEFSEFIRSILSGSSDGDG